MFIKITSIVIYSVTVSILLFLSFKKSLEFWKIGETAYFALMMVFVLILLVMLIIAIMNLTNIFKEWRHTKLMKKNFDNIDKHDIFD